MNADIYYFHPDQNNQDNEIILNHHEISSAFNIACITFSLISNVQSVVKSGPQHQHWPTWNWSILSLLGLRNAARTLFVNIHSGLVIELGDAVSRPIEQIGNKGNFITTVTTQ